MNFRLSLSFLFPHFQVVSLLCLVFSLIILVVSISTTAWLKTFGYRLGLFEECVDDSAKRPIPPNLPPVGTCGKVGSRGNSESN
jgi:hypothetical protein